MKIKISANNRVIELGFSLPRIPVENEVIRFWQDGVAKVATVDSILWDLDNMEVIIFVENE